MRFLRQNDKILWLVFLCLHNKKFAGTARDSSVLFAKLLISRTLGKLLKKKWEIEWKPCNQSMKIKKKKRGGSVKRSFLKNLWLLIWKIPNFPEVLYFEDIPWWTASIEPIFWHWTRSLTVGEKFSLELLCCNYVHFRVSTKLSF